MVILSFLLKKESIFASRCIKQSVFQKLKIDFFFQLDFCDFVQIQQIEAYRKCFKNDMFQIFRKRKGCVTSGDLNEDFEDSMVVRRRVITRRMYIIWFTIPKHVLNKFKP